MDLTPVRPPIATPVSTQYANALILGDIALPAAGQGLEFSQPPPAAVVVPPGFAERFARAARAYQRSLRRVRRAAARSSFFEDADSSRAARRSRGRYEVAEEDHHQKSGRIAQLIRELTGRKPIQFDDGKSWYHRKSMMRASRWAEVVHAGCVFMYDGTEVTIRPATLTARI